MLLVNNKGASDYYDMYSSGYYVNIDRENGTFYWDHDENRFVIDLNDEIASKSKKILKNELKSNFEFGFNSNNSLVLDHLQDNHIKEKSWLNSRVREIYEELLTHNYAFTMEAYYQGKIAGGLFGVALGNIVTIDTMYGIPVPKEMRSSSKALFCCALIEMFNAGVKVIDVETSHHPNHPCFRLGEKEIDFADFRKYLRSQSNIHPNIIYEHFEKVWGNHSSSKSVDMYLSVNSSPSSIS